MTLRMLIGRPLRFCLSALLLHLACDASANHQHLGGATERVVDDEEQQQQQKQQQQQLKQSTAIDDERLIHWLDEDEDEKEAPINTANSRSLVGLKDYLQTSPTIRQQPRQENARQSTTPPLTLDAFMLPSDLLRPFDNLNDDNDDNVVAEVDYMDDGVGGDFEGDVVLSEESTGDVDGVDDSGTNATSTFGYETSNVTIREDAGAGEAPLVVVVTGNPTKSPQPSASPTVSPMPSFGPSDIPSTVPTESPAPSDLPSESPSNRPSGVPTRSPAPSVSPSDRPSSTPSESPSLLPSTTPTLSNAPSSFPSDAPSLVPSDAPSRVPSLAPSAAPSSLPSVQPSSSPSAAPSSMPSSGPTLTCHDEPDYRSPFNGNFCAGHVGASCLQWRFLGLTLDSLEDLIISCPESCNVDCGTLNRFDIEVSYQISNVPGLLDAVTVKDLNSLTKDYIEDFLRIQEPFVEFFIDEVELLSQSIVSRSGKKNRGLAEEVVNLRVSSAIRGFAFGVADQRTTELLVSTIDSPGYTNSIQNSRNVNLEEAYAFSAAEKAENNVILPDERDADDEGNSASIPLIVVSIIFAFGAAFAGITFHIKRTRRRNARLGIVNDGGYLSCWKRRQRRKVVAIPREDEVQSPESMGVASHVGSLFSFDDTATAGTNGLMRFIGSFSRSEEEEPTSPSSRDEQSASHETMIEGGPDEELGVTPLGEEDETEDDESEDEPHPLTGYIPNMVVYDNIDDDDEANELSAQIKSLYPKERGPAMVPSKCVEASSEFKASIGNRIRPSATNDLAEYLSETSDFVIDPMNDPATLQWRRLESRRPSPIGIVMDSDDDDVSVASTPVRRQNSMTDSQIHRKTKSLDDYNILESHSDIAFSEKEEKEFLANISPMALPGLGNMTADSPYYDEELAKSQTTFAHVVPNDSPKGEIASPDNSITWVRAAKTVASSETPTPWGNASQPQSAKAKTSSGGLQETRPSFWKRSPMAKGVKDAIWSKRVGNPTTTRNGVPATPTRPDMPQRRGSPNLPPSTPPRTDFAMRRSSMNGPPPSTPPTRAEYIRRASGCLPPSTPGSKPDSTRRSSTPTRLEGFGRRLTTPSNGEQTKWRNPSPTRFSMHSNSEESHSESRHSVLKNGSASFSTGHGSSDHEERVYFDFRAPRIGKLGLVINSSPQTGPVVEQVKDYSTLFGCVHVGDRIVEVDGAETSHMTIKEVTKRLAGKYGIRANYNEVKIKVSRGREREWNEDDRYSVHSAGSASLGSYASPHQRIHSDPDTLSARLSLNNNRSDQGLSLQNYSNHSKPGEEV